eukprot:125695-Rhodomonas_salina.4
MPLLRHLRYRRATVVLGCRGSVGVRAAIVLRACLLCAYTSLYAMPCDTRYESGAAVPIWRKQYRFGAAVGGSDLAETGYNLGNIVVKPSDAKSLALEAPSVYELLPFEDYAWVQAPYTALTMNGYPPTPHSSTDVA